MPPFPERESSILAKLKKKKPDSAVRAGLLREEKTPTEKPTMNGQIPVIAAEPQAQVNVGTQTSKIIT